MQQRHLDKADAIREALSRQADQIRTKSHWSDEAKAGALARAHNDAKKRMDELEKTAAVETDADRLTAHRRAFGGDIPGVDRSTLIVSTRDAMDRAERLTSPKDAAALLARAEQTGDEPLARAVAAQAHSQSNAHGLVGDDPSAWAEIVDDYTSRRPGKADAVQQLNELGNGKLNVRNMFAFVVPKPTEISSLPHGQLQSLINSAPTAPSVA